MDACSIRSFKDNSSSGAVLVKVLKASWGIDAEGCSDKSGLAGSGSEESMVIEDVNVIGSLSSVAGARITSNMDVCSMRSETSSKSKSGSGGAKDGRRRL